MIKFKAKVATEVYSNENFKIYGMKVNTEDKNYDKLKFNKYGTVTIVGDLPELEYDVEYVIEGEEKYNSKFKSYQYENIKIHREKPTDLQSARTFLESIITKRQADILLEVYPDIVDRIINNKEVDLTLTKGIKEITFKKIKEKVIRDFCLIDLINEYSEYNMTISMLRKLYNKFSSIEKIKENMEKDPYECLCSINRVGFVQADNVILKIKPHLKDSIVRCKACINHCLDENEQNGNTYITKADLIASAKKLIGEGIKYIEDVLLFAQDIVVIDGDKIANKYTYECEKYVSNKLMEMLEDNIILNIDYSKYSTIGDMSLTQQQQNALKNFCDYRVSMLVGYAGAGKTQTTKALINLLEDNELRYKLFAPTGKASKVLSTYCERPASTIHRGLGYGVDPETGRLDFWYDEDNPLPYDVIIVDESSMIDIFMMMHLLKAVSSHKTRIVFILDPEQLPSVGAGNIGYDLVQSGKIPVTMLTQIFRYGEGGLMQIATKTRNGESYIENKFRGIQNYGTKKDYSLISIEQEKTCEYVKKIYKKLIDTGVSVDDIIVLSPLNKGDYGTANINKIIQDIINPYVEGKEEITCGNITYRVGDRVIQIKNDYEMLNTNDEIVPIMNGNTGTVKSIEGKIMIVSFEDGDIVYQKDDLSNLNLGYCISVHKSQGSAFKHVIFISPKSHAFFLNRNLLYVAITRAKERVYHITTAEVINYALQKRIALKRHTLLRNFIKDYNKT